MPDRLLVLAPNWLGDVVMALPALADLRQGHAGATLIVAARRSVAGILSLVPGVDEVITLERRDDAGRLRAARADAAVLLPNSFASAWLTRRAGIPERWGYATDWRSPLLSRAIRTPGVAMHHAAYYQHLVHALGAPRGPLEPSLVVPPGAIDAARSLLAARGWDGTQPLVTLAPGAAYGTAKRWRPASFARLADRVVTGRGAFVVLAGSGADRETTRWIASAMTPAAAARTADLAGETTLVELAGVLRASSACVSNDSGTMHLAAALGVSVVALFGPTREHETGPLASAGGQVRVLTRHAWCRPCMLRECPIDHRCMTRMTPDDVYLAFQEVCA